VVAGKLPEAVDDAVGGHGRFAAQRDGVDMGSIEGMAHGVAALAGP